jgi:hypothetical protein
MVEGYETEEERARRLAREQAEAQRAAEQEHQTRAEAFYRALPGLLSRLHQEPHDCMIEIMGKTLLTRNAVVKDRVPAG